MDTTNVGISHKERNWALVIVLTSHLMIVLDIFIVITGLPVIRQGLGFSPLASSWVQNTYLLFPIIALLIVLPAECTAQRPLLNIE